jgi:hypothetical protein
MGQSGEQRQPEALQIEPTDPFGVVRIQPMSLDAVLPEFAAASGQLGFAEATHRSAPITMRHSTADVRRGTGRRFGKGHRSTPDRSCIRRGAMLCGIYEIVRNRGQFKDPTQRVRPPHQVLNPVVSKKARQLNQESTIAHRL